MANDQKSVTSAGLNMVAIVYGEIFIGDYWRIASGLARMVSRFGCCDNVAVTFCEAHFCQYNRC